MYPSRDGELVGPPSPRGTAASRGVLLVGERCGGHGASRAHGLIVDRVVTGSLWARGNGVTCPFRSVSAEGFTSWGRCGWRCCAATGPFRPARARGPEGVSGPVPATARGPCGRSPRRKAQSAKPFGVIRRLLGTPFLLRRPAGARIGLWQSEKVRARRSCAQVPGEGRRRVPRRTGVLHHPPPVHPVRPGRRWWGSRHRRPCLPEPVLRAPAPVHLRLALSVSRGFWHRSWGAVAECHWGSTSWVSPQDGLPGQSKFPGTLASRAGIV
ncbi:hypothetical protein STRTUCAR8_10168 [Streptomyces turgidiscabies Car8]|uniref:Uncharacterized protein n=1 Tax=Streptomyces turgidiscabies (strain Car8) TaxID=698760 RepID=L7FBD8_STRT8|nr:hypothetical protein STRTUCAR8_00093 [Streptomyces turgidiscabies Car8]ELP70130.1 hypothetical protein STRTUCAR8_10168 [Streptomyces turgidiscabies Car8]